MLKEDIMHELARVFDATGNVLIGAALAQIKLDGENIAALERDLRDTQKEQVNG